MVGLQDAQDPVRAQVVHFRDPPEDQRLLEGKISEVSLVRSHDLGASRAR